MEQQLIERGLAIQLAAGEEGIVLDEAARLMWRIQVRRFLAEIFCRLELPGKYHAYPARVGPGGVAVPAAFVGAVVEGVFYDQAYIQFAIQ